MMAAIFVFSNCRVVFKAKTLRFNITLLFYVLQGKNGHANLNIQ